MNKSTPTARYLQARITHTTTTLITRLENILAIALPPAQSVSAGPDDIEDAAAAGGSGSGSGGSGSGLATTAIESFNLDVETTALVKAAEDLMVLGRGLKELWLLGDFGSDVKDEVGEGEREGDGKEGGPRQKFGNEEEEDGEDDKGLLLPVGARKEDVGAVAEGLERLLVPVDEIVK